MSGRTRRKAPRAPLRQRRRWRRLKSDCLLKTVHAQHEFNKFSHAQQSDGVRRSPGIHTEMLAHASCITGTDSDY